MIDQMVRNREGGRKTPGVPVSKGESTAKTVNSDFFQRWFRAPFLGKCPSHRRFLPRYGKFPARVPAGIRGSGLSGRVSNGCRNPLRFPTRRCTGRERPPTVPLFSPKTSRRAFSARVRSPAPPAPRIAIRAGRPADGPGRNRRRGCRGRSGSLRRFLVFCQRP